MDAGYPRQSEPMASQPRKFFPVWPWNMYIPVHYLRVTQTISFWPMEQTQHHQVLANGPPPLKYFGLLPTQPGGMPRRLPCGAPSRRFILLILHQGCQALCGSTVYEPQGIFSFFSPDFFGVFRCHLPNNNQDTHMCPISATFVLSPHSVHCAVCPVAAVPRVVTRTASQWAVSRCRKFGRAGLIRPPIRPTSPAELPVLDSQGTGSSVEAQSMQVVLLKDCPIPSASAIFLSDRRLLVPRHKIK